MALLGSCCGCGLAVSSAVLGVYLSVAYVIAFAVELWQILESPVTPPTAARLLCFEYFILFMSSTLLLHGLAIKKTTFLLIWLFMMGVLLGPEAGLVLYLSIHYWKLTSVYGLVEITCWTCRLLVNTISLLCVQSLHSIWSEEKSVLLRLEALKTIGVNSHNGEPTNFYQNRGERRLNMCSVLEGYTSKDTSTAVTKQKSESNSFSNLNFAKNKEDVQNERYHYGDSYVSNEIGCSEFNASSFDPSIIDARLQNMPYSKMGNNSNNLNADSEAGEVDELNRNVNRTLSKTRSLIDLSKSSFNKVEIVKFPDLVDPFSSIYTNFTERQPVSSQQVGNNTGSLDRMIIGNKRLKILSKFSPFLNKKSTNVNIYQINPPNHGKLTESIEPSYFDNQLSKVYCNRGMYIFNDKIGKVLFYPPDFFCKSSSIKFRNRIDSYGSNQSRSSMGTDSEDTSIRHISDVAL